MHFIHMYSSIVYKLPINQTVKQSAMKILCRTHGSLKVTGYPLIKFVGTKV